MTIQEIYEINPKIRVIIINARKLKGGTIQDFERFKRVLNEHVGFNTANQKLNTPAAYNTVIAELAKALRL